MLQTLASRHLGNPLLLQDIHHIRRITDCSFEAEMEGKMSSERAFGVTCLAPLELENAKDHHFRAGDKCSVYDHL